MRNLLLLPFFLLCVNLNAQIVTDRPDQTESSSSVGKGNLQIESGFLLGFEGEGSDANRQILAPSTLFRYGVVDWLELRFVSQIETLRQGEDAILGISDLEVGMKVELYAKEDSPTEMALLSHLVAPIGTEGLSGGRFGTVNKLCISHGLGENLDLGYNLGYDYMGQGRGSLTYSLALGVGVNDKVGVYIEPYGEVAEFEQFLLNADAGFTYLLHDNLQFDFSFGSGITHRMNYLSLGVSWKLEKG